MQVVRIWQGRLGLASWDIQIDLDEHPEEGAHAQIWRSRDYDQARICLNREWQTWPVRRLHAVVVHELLHVVLRDVEFIADLVDGQLHRDVENVIRKSHMHHIEQAVDRLAHRLVELVPPA